MKHLRFIASLILMLTIGICIQAQDVQFIGIHMGNPENLAALDYTAYPDLNFYYNDSELIEYREDQKMVGYNTNLKGLYGEVPEKMGFGANYVGEEGKYKGIRNYTGTLMLVDPAGTIALQSFPGTASNWSTKAVKSELKRYGKNKYAKPLKANKQKYLKESGIGELESYKGSKVDKSEQGLTGWTLPDLSIKDENGKAYSLKELTEGKATVIVFFTLNGIHYKRGDKKGNIISEANGGLLISPQAAADNLESKVMNTEASNKKEAKKAFAKAMFNAAKESALTSSDISMYKRAILAGKELNDSEKAMLYRYFTGHLGSAQALAEELK